MANTHSSAVTSRRSDRKLVVLAAPHRPQNAVPSGFAAEHAEQVHDMARTLGSL